MRYAIGLDHGTTFCSVAALREDKQVPEMIGLGESGQSQQIPTVICIDDSKQPPEISIGTKAENQDKVHPERVVKWYKPEMELLKPKEEEQKRKSEFLNRSLEELATIMISGIKDWVEQRINEPVEAAVITVPAWFHDRARKMTLAAAEAAGITHARLENEPTAAAYFCHQQKPLDPGSIMLVYDLGGGTFDTSVVRFNPDGTLEVLASSGDMKLGGHLWTLKLAEWAAPKYYKDHNIDLMADTAGKYDLYRACEKCKRELSLMPETRLMLRPGERPTAEYTITRGEFESITHELIDRTGKVMAKSLGLEKLAWKDITEILLVGGTTRMPQVKRYIEGESGGTPIRELGDRDHIVAQGAALLHRNSMKPISLSKTPGARSSDVEIDGVIRKTAHSLSTWIVDQRRLLYAAVIGTGSQIPAEGKRRFKRQRNKATEIHVPVFEGGVDKAEIDLRQDISGYRTLWRFHGIPATPVEKDEIEVTFRYTLQQTTEVEAIYKPGTPEEAKLSGVEEDWEEMKDIDTNVMVGEIPLVVAIDCSGSMSGAKITEAKNQLGQIADEYLNSNFSLSVVAFPHRIFGHSGEIIRCSTEPADVKREVGDLMAGGGTPMHAGLKLAHEVMKETSDESASRYIFLITDGAPDSQPAASKAADAIKGDKIKLFGIPIKAGTRGTDFLVKICDKTEPIDTTAGISRAFRNLLTGG